MGLLDKFYAVGEPALGLLSGAVAEPVAGWAGLLGGGAEGVQKTRNALTYQPRTQAGKEGQNALARLLLDGKSAMVDNNPPVRMAVDGFNALADRAGEYNPLMGAAMKTVPAAVGLLAGPGSQVSRNALAEAVKGTGRTLGPKAAEMMENHLLRTGGILPAVGNLDGIRIEHVPEFTTPYPAPAQLWAKSPYGEVFGKIQGDSLKIGASEVNENARGKGHGLGLYTSLIDEAARRGLNVFSDGVVSPEAQRVYQAMAKNGYKVEEMPHFVFEDGTRVGREIDKFVNGPVYKVMPMQSAKNESIMDRVRRMNSNSAAMGELDDAIRR